MKYITVKLTEDQAWCIIHALENDWEEETDTEFKELDLKRMWQEHNKEVRKANAFRQRLINKIKQS